MDSIYSNITSHHTVTHIDKTIGLCEFSLFIIPLLFIGFWAVNIICNKIFAKTKKNLMELLFNSAPLGLIIAIVGFFYLSKIYSC